MFTVYILTRIVIYFVDCYSVPASAPQYSYDIDGAQYAQPWNTDEILEIDITPEDGGTGNDVCIHLTDIVEKGEFLSYYAISKSLKLNTRHTHNIHMNIFRIFCFESK